MCADAEIGARLATPSKRTARIWGAHGTHDNGPFNVSPMLTKEVTKAAYGYSRDHRPDARQLILALLLRKRGARNTGSGTVSNMRRGLIYGLETIEIGICR
jgi:hypothetical protein